jgi:hypothetical protein
MCRDALWWTWSSVFRTHGTEYKSSINFHAFPSILLFLYLLYDMLITSMYSKIVVIVVGISGDLFLLLAMLVTVDCIRCYGCFDFQELIHTVFHIKVE